MVVSSSMPPARRELKLPPTIARLKAMGAEGIEIMCRDCRRSAALYFDMIALPDETPFPEIVELRRFRAHSTSFPSSNELETIVLAAYFYP